MSVSDIILEYVCPSLGGLIASILFAAPVQDLRRCLLKGFLGELNPFPWVMMTGNCLGWVVYGYYTKDAFVVAANLPGLILSLWLNIGASKLQYLELYHQKRTARGEERPEQQWDASPSIEEDSSELIADRRRSVRTSSDEYFVMVPQERSLLRVLSAWAVVIVWVGWFSSGDPAAIIGLVVNANLIFFYASPILTIRTVIAEGNSNSIHAPTMCMSWANTSFWIAYGLARRDPVIILPNSVGLVLGIVQGLLCLVYPRSSARTLILENAEEDGHADIPPEEDVPTRPVSNSPAVLRI